MAINFIPFVSVSLLTALLLLKPIRCQRILGNPCGGPANFDGTDIARPYLVDNSTGTPVYTYIDDEDYHPPSNRSKRGATSRSYRLWPKGIVHYTFHISLTDPEKEKIFEAMRHWEDKTCIRFYPGQNGQYGGILFFRGSGCCSYVGRFSGFIQPVSIGYYCSFSSAVHEIGHVLGFWHEQSRPDRNQYVNIHQQNIKSGFESNFYKESAINSLGVPYDFNSIMHYSATAFAKTNTVTISTKEKNIPFGLAPELSPLDIKQTNLLYKSQCSLRSASESVSRLPAPKTTTPSPVTLPAGRCNKHLSGKSGQISPPDNPYKSNTDCAWVIEVPKGYYIYVVIYGLQLDGPCNDANSNHIGLYTGYNSDRLYRRVCGFYSSYQFTYGGQYVYVTFHTNSQANSRSRRGFSRIEFTARDIDECRSNYCDHDCENLEGSYKCTCRKGYYLAGTRRCFDHNECGDNNGGCSHTCVNMAGSYRCECPTGYSLLPNKRDCIRGGSPCLRNNGGCDHICTDTSNGAACSCRSGYQLVNGKTCRDIDECIVNTGICGADKVCTNTEGSYLCQCKIGYRRLSNGDCQDVDECSTTSRPCGVNKQCVNTPGSYKCICNSGYKEAKNGNCEDINECSDKTLCSDANQKCLNEPGTYKCVCRKGYHDVNGVCEDVDECTTSAHNCKSNEYCVNKPGKYSCKCVDGYQLVNKICEDINECDEKSTCDQVCINTLGSYHCSCNEGYSLSDNGNSCEDIDECKGRNGRKLCPISNTQCINKPGVYACECKDGYKQLQDGTCEDINECEDDGVCEHRCINRIGDYRCKCRKGYLLMDDEKSCKDIDECAVDNGGCDDTCINTNGSYSCQCNNGLQLLSDKKSCGLLSKECIPGSHGCRSSCDDGNDLCCHSGHTLNRNGMLCRDIDECAEGKNKCGQKCINMIGSFHCGCSTGYRLRSNQKDCRDIDECKNGANNCSHTCINTPGSYLCECPRGFELDTDMVTCRDINECRTNNGGCDHMCRNTEGSFQCFCNTSYMLAADQKTCLNSCDRDVTSESTGHIGTTGFPNTAYAPNSNCTWIIELPEQYKSVELKVDGMFIEESSNCTKDRLTILNGKDENALSMASYCGNKLPAAIQSSTRVVTVKFASDDSVNMKGFSLQYKGLTERVKGVYGCNSIVKKNTTIALATFPLKYTTPIDCVYSLIAPNKDQKVKVTFLYLDIQDAVCSTDRVEVYDGKKLIANKKMAEICSGGTREREFTSTGRHMRIRYIGKSLNAYQGFHASVKFISF